jgi:formyltetrahydrofolate deformylase
LKQFATITVIGKDKTGVIARFTNFLFEQHANIEALEEQVTRGQFSMILQASWDRRGLDLSTIQEGLRMLAGELSMEVAVRFSEPHRLQRMAIMITKEPHCLEALLDGIRGTRLKAEPVLVISNRADLEPLARKYRLPFLQVDWDADRRAAERMALKALDEAQADFVVLARFMKILSPNFVWRYKNKIINVHPSLLPSFPGPQAYRQAYEHGVKIVGVTAHFVSMHLDEGPIIAQESFRIRPGMTLPEIIQRGQTLESKVLVKAVRLYLARKLDVFWGIVQEV